MRRISESDAEAVLAEAAIGAGSSIEIGLSSPYIDRLRFVRDYAYLADTRLTRKILVAVLENRELSSHIAKELRPFLDNGWEVRIGPYNRVGFIILIDEEGGLLDLSNPEKNIPA
jgi:hypothetical protein